MQIVACFGLGGAVLRAMAKRTVPLVKARSLELTGIGEDSGRLFYTVKSRPVIAQRHCAFGAGCYKLGPVCSANS